MVKTKPHMFFLKKVFIIKSSPGMNFWGKTKMKRYRKIMF